MRPRRHSKKLILFLALSALALLVTCAEKIVNNSTEAISFQLAVSFENSLLAELVETYQVTIISGSDSIIAELEMVDGVVEGTIENVPEGTGLLVVLEGLDAGGIVIYRGSAIIDVIAGQITEVEIALLPVVKLIRTSPKFLETEFGTPFSSMVELYNLGGLTQIGLTIEFDKATLQLDSVSMGSGLPSGSILTYSTDSSGKLAVNVSHSSTIVDSSGNTVLAQIYFRGSNSNLCQDSTVIDIIIDSLTAQATTIEEILADRSKIIINRGRISLSKNSLQFGFGVPGLTLAFQGIKVTDSCGNSIPFTISTEHDWIDLNTRFGGLTPDSIYIDIDTTGLAVGSYTGSFIVQSPKAVNSPFEVMVTLQLDRGVRTLVVEPGLLAFSAEEFGPLPAPQQFTISELNSFNIPFSVSENISWLELSDSTGTTEQVITAIITSTELAPGIYADSIEIISAESNNSPQYVIVNYAIGNVPKFLQVVPDSIYFEFVQNSGDYPAEQLRIFESRGFSIPYSVIENIEWLLLSDTSGMTEDTITLYPNPNTPPGLYVDSIWIVSDSAEIGAISINVILQVIEADKFLIVSPDSLHFDYWIFGVEPIPTPLDTLFVTELNGYNTHFNVTEEIPWLRIWNVDSLTPGFVEIFIDRFNEPGNYIDSIFISSENAVNSPISVVISYNVIYRPLDFIFDPDTLYFTADQDGALPVSDRFQVLNVETGTTIVQFVVTESIPWLTVQPDNGRIGDFVNVNITSTALEPSIYFDSIRIEQPGTELIEPAYEYIKYTVADRIPPSAVTDLAVDSISLSSAYVSWTASGDDSTVGTATESDLRYSTNLTTLLNWNGATQASGEAAPLVSGSSEQFEVVSLEPSNMYYFGIEIIDNSGNRSEISNIDSVYIPNLVPDPPVLISPDNGDIDIPNNPTFVWHSSERADSYQLQLGTSPNLDSSDIFTDSGDTTFVMTDVFLWNDLTYYWRVRASNDGGYSDWSSGWSFTTERFCEEITFPDNGLRIAVLKALGRPSSDTDPICRYDTETIDSLDASNFEITDLTGIEALINLFYLRLSSNSLTDISILATLTSLNIIDFENNDIFDISPLLSNSGLGLNDTISLINNPLDSQSMFTHIPALNSNGVTVLTTNIYTEIAVRPIVFDTTELKSTVLDSVKITVDVAGQAYPTPFIISKLSSWLVISAPTDTLLVSPLTFWVKVDLTGLLPDTLYDTITVSSFKDPNPDIKETVKLIVKDAPPTISGFVKDNSGSAVNGTLVKVYDSYPNGTVLDSIFTNSSGAFEFFDIDGAVTLRTFKENFYPVMTELITPDTSLDIRLNSLDSYSPSDSWIDIYCGTTLVYGSLLQPNDVVEAFDPGGNLCGRSVVTTAGTYGFMPVYRDNEFSTEDEGCVYGDAVTIKVNQEVAKLEQPLVYPADYQNFEVCFDVTGEILNWIVVLKPAGGETFFIDSSAAVKWSSNVTSDTLDLYLINPLIAPVFLEKIADDGEHTLTIPRTAFKSNDWSLVLVDAASSVSGTSNQFVLDAIEFILAPDTLRMLGTANNCTPSTQTFEISESHNYLIPYSGSESIPWLSITNSEGNTSSIVEVVTDISGLTIGTYFDSIKIESPDAVNSPAYVYVELELIEFLCGDFNDDCKIKIGDLANLIDYLYRAGPPPLLADAINVDRCDGLDIADVDFWYDNFAFSSETNCDGSETCTSSENDMGNADSLKLVLAQAPVFINSAFRLRLELYLFSDENMVRGLAVGFDWDNSNLRLDSVVFSEKVENNFHLLRTGFEDDNIHMTNRNKRFLFAGNRSLFPGLEASASQKLLASYYFSLYQWNASDSIVIDTLAFNEGTTYKIISADGAYQPVWQGPLVIRNENSDK